MPLKFCKTFGLMLKTKLMTMIDVYLLITGQRHLVSFFSWPRGKKCYDKETKHSEMTRIILAAEIFFKIPFWTTVDFHCWLLATTRASQKGVKVLEYTLTGIYNKIYNDHPSHPLGLRMFLIVICVCMDSCCSDTNSTPWLV